MIQTTKSIFACMLFLFLACMVQAQDQLSPASGPSQQDAALPDTDTAIATRQALLYADSLVKASFYSDWDTYTSLSCASAIKYYGGKDAFKEHCVSMYYRSERKTEEKPESLHLLSILEDTDDWQCVIEKVRETFVEGHGKTRIYTYLVGQSGDNGKTWKFVDVSHNSLENLGNIFPSIFGTLSIPESKTVYVDETAIQEEVDSQQRAVKKKPVAVVKKHTSSK